MRDCGLVVRRMPTGTRFHMRHKFNFFLGSDFLENFLAFRLLHLGGRLGSGKTLLAIALAKWLYDSGRVAGIFSNIPVDSSYIPIRDTICNSAVVLDEGWSFADARNSSSKFSGYGAYARKFDCYWISPSVFSVDKRMAQVRARRISDVWAIDSWLYSWLNIENDKGYFLFTGYKELYGRYDHKAIPVDDAGILDSLKFEIRASGGSMRSVFKSDKYAR